MNRLRRIFLNTMQMLLPVKKGIVLFSSFMGMYNDNPKYICEELHARRPDLRIVWTVSEKCREALPEYAESVVLGSPEYIKLKCRAQVLVDNHTGIRCVTIRKKLSPGKRLYCKFLSKKRKKQYSVSTWHGMPLKHICADEPNNDILKICTSSSYTLAGNDFTAGCMQTALLNTIPVKIYGSPRNDILFRDVDVASLKQKLHLPEERKVVLFAPTFRDDVISSGVMQLKEMDFAALFAALQEKFGGEWCLVVRVHHRVMLEIDVAALAKEYGGMIIDGNLGDDMAEYLVCTDVLITDYSSSMFDYMLTGRPCFLYAPDRAHYEGEERGFYMSYDALPFPKADTAAELVSNIASFDNEKYGEGVSRFLEEIGNAEDGHASERVVDDILTFLDTGKKS